MPKWNIFSYICKSPKLVKAVSECRRSSKKMVLESGCLSTVSGINGGCCSYIENPMWLHGLLLSLPIILLLHLISQWQCSLRNIGILKFVCIFSLLQMYLQKSTFCSCGKKCSDSSWLILFMLPCTRGKMRNQNPERKMFAEQMWQGLAPF